MSSKRPAKPRGCDPMSGFSRMERAARAARVVLRRAGRGVTAVFETAHREVLAGDVPRDLDVVALPVVKAAREVPVRLDRSAELALRVLLEAGEVVDLIPVRRGA